MPSCTRNEPAGSVTGAPPFAALGAPPTVVGGPFSLPVSFNEPVTGLTASDFTLTNGTATALIGAVAAVVVAMSSRRCRTDEAAVGNEGDAGVGSAAEETLSGTFN